jgi:hypothetical protein
MTEFNCRRSTVLDSLDELLRSLKVVYIRKSSRFYIGSNSSCIVMEVQNSSKNDPAKFLFTVNLGLWNAAIAANFGGPTSCKNIGALECHWSLRVGQLCETKEGVWWALTDNLPERNAILDEVWTHASGILNLFLPLQSDAALLDFLLKEKAAFLDPLNQWAYVLALSISLSDNNGREQAMTKFDEISRTRTIPIAHKILIKSALTLK